MTYNRDLQEDKEALFDSVDQIKLVLEVYAGMIPEIEVDSQRTREAANDPGLLATDLADYLVRKGIPFRHAHDVVGLVVRSAEKSGTPLNQLGFAALHAIDAHFEKDVLAVFDLKKAMALRDLVGAPGTKQVIRQIARWKKQLGR